MLKHGYVIPLHPSVSETMKQSRDNWTRKISARKKLPLLVFHNFFFFLNQLRHILTYQSHGAMSKTIAVFSALTYVMKQHTNEKVQIGIKMNICLK